MATETGNSISVDGYSESVPISTLEKDRLTAQNDYLTDCKGEEEIRFIMEHLDHQDSLILQIVKRLEEQHMEMKEHLARLDPGMAKQLGSDIQEMAAEQVEQQYEEQ